MLNFGVNKNGQYFKYSYINAVDLCVRLYKTYDIDPENIISHAEGHKLRLASNHTVMLHWFFKHGVTMDDFRK